MNVNISARRIGSAVAATALAFGALTVAATSASASTIPTGKFQLCAQGTYPVSAWISSAPGGASASDGIGTPLVRPGECVILKGPKTSGRTVAVEVTGYGKGGKEFLVDYHGWNSSKGLGLGAQGTPRHHALWSW